MASVYSNGDLSVSYPLNIVLCLSAGTYSVGTHSLVSFPYLSHPREWGYFQFVGHFLLLAHSLEISKSLAISV